MNFSPRFRAVLLLSALAVPTAVLARQQAGARIDPRNLALKSESSVEAEAMARRVAEFGEDVTLVVALEWIQAHATAADEGHLADFAPGLGRIAGVRSVLPFPGSSPGFPAWTVFLEPTTDSREFTATVRRVESVALRTKPPTARLYVTGQPLAELAIAEAVRDEQSAIMPVVTIVLLAVLCLCYRHLGVAAAALVPAGAGVIWTCGLHALLGHELDPISSLLQPVLLTVGVAGAVHVIEAFLRRRGDRLDVAAAAVAAVRDVLAPAALTVVTTMAGFLALGTNEIPAVVRFGVFAGIGVMLTFGLTFSIAPSMLILFAGSAKLSTRRRANAGVLEFSRRCVAWIQVRRPAILGLSAVIAVAACLALPALRVDNDPVAILPETHTFRRGLDKVAGRLGGVETFDVLVPSANAAPVIGELAKEITALPRVLRLAGPPRRSEQGTLLMSAIIGPGGSRQREQLFDQVECRAADLGLGSARVTGTSVLVARDSGRLIRRQLFSMGLMLGFLFLVFAITFRSIALGILGLIPNVFPCLAVYGSLAVVGEPMTVASSMIGAVMLGLVVDDTIHLLYRFQDARRRGRSPRLAVAAAVRQAGSAVVITSGTLSLGFAAALFGGLETTRTFGALASGTVVIALLADLVLLPALLLRGVESSVAVEPREIAALCEETVTI